MAQSEILQVKFDLTKTHSVLKPHYVQGRELVDWENGPDMLTFIRTMFDEGYRSLSAGGSQVYLFKRIDLS